MVVNSGELNLHSRGVIANYIMVDTGTLLKDKIKQQVYQNISLPGPHDNTQAQAERLTEPLSQSRTSTLR